LKQRVDYQEAKKAAAKKTGEVSAAGTLNFRDLFDMTTEHYKRSVHSFTIQESCKYHETTNLAVQSLL